VTAPADWWSDFFDRDYLRSYSPKLTEEASRDEALSAVALAGVAPGARVLDAPCGFGRHSIPLADAGYDMVGVDLSADQLSEARARAGSRDNPVLVEGDLRQLPFADAEFDCAVNLFSSIGYWGDEGDLAVLRELRRVLRPDAALVIETMHRDRLVWILRERDWEHLPDGAVFLEERRFDLATGVIEGTHAVFGEGTTGQRRQYTLRVYTATELVRLLGQAGFGRIECFGSFAEEPLTRETRLVAVAHKL
jgi:SAM-dependent methyltransferase